MHEIGVETVGQGALKLTGFLKELMQRRNIPFESLYTVRTIKEVRFCLLCQYSYISPSRAFSQLGATDQLTVLELILIMNSIRKELIADKPSLSSCTCKENLLRRS